MADTTFVNNVTLTDSDWFNDLNRLHYTILGDPADASAVRNTLGIGPAFGLTLSNNTSDATNDIDIAAGARWDNGRTVRMVLAAGVTRQLDVAFGSGNGGRFDTSIADGTWHVFLISNGTLVNVGFSQSLNPTGTANYPSGYTLYRRIGSILRESGAIVAFSQVRDEFLRLTTVLDVNVTNPGTAAVDRTLSVPNGIKTHALFNALVAATGGASSAWFSAKDVTDAAPSNTAAPLSNAGGTAATNVFAGYAVRTDTSRTIRSRFQFSDTNTSLRIATVGWIDQEIMEP